MAGDTQLVTLDIENGINRNVTTYQAKGKWTDADKIRFKAGNVEKLGGWSKLQDGGAPYRGVARDAITWAALNGDKFYGLGTHLGLFVYSGGNFYDITPVRQLETETSAFNTTSGSSAVEVSAAGHAAVVGDYAEFPSGVSVANLTLEVSNGVYVITSVNTNSFIIEASAAANATVTKGGGAGAKGIRLLLNTGKQNNEPTTGYGSGTYGSGVYGTGTVGSLTANVRLWSMDAWGEDLMALPRGGQVYRWDKSDGLATRASVAHANVPTQNNFMLITEETRCMMLFGTSADGGDFDPLVFRWSQQEDYSVWSAAVTNAAGQLRLNSGSYIVGAVKSKGDIVAFTDEGAHTITYQGAPFFFGQQRVGTNCGLIGPSAAVDVNGTTYWLSKSSFYRYSGVVEKLPSSLDKAIFEPESPYSINYDQKEKIFAGVNSEFNEIWWFYPSLNSIENDRYVVYNYLEDFWFDGSLDRTTWVDSNLMDRPLATSTSVASYAHEISPHDADGMNFQSFVESGYVDISKSIEQIGNRESGTEFIFLDRVIPDVTSLTGDYMKLWVKYKKYPFETAKTKGPYRIGPTTTKIPLRLRGRQVAFRVEVSGVGSDFQLGNFRAGVAPDGGR
jgi:hypothetical protein